MENFVISNSEIQSYLGLDETTFPKYTTVLMNIANRTSQGTRPNVVGQLSELRSSPFCGVNSPLVFSS